MRRLNLTRLNKRRDSQGDSACEMFPGDACPIEGCEGKIGVYTTVRTSRLVTRYLCCKVCGFKPDNKLTETTTT